MRVVSLVPSSTETLLALGVDVVACTKYCEQPDIVHVGGSKNPDVDAIVALAPDLVVLDREENRIEDHDALVAAGLAVFVSDVTDLASATAVVDDLATATSATVPEIAGQFDAPEGVDHRRTAFVPIWRRPWMSIGSSTYGASVLAAIGVDVLTFGDDPYPTIELEQVAAAQPDFVLVPSEPYDFSDDHVTDLAQALPEAMVLRVDGQDLFWWGIRTSRALSRLSATVGLPPTP